MAESTWIKMCGVTIPEDLEFILSSGANAIGLNFIARSKRRVEVARARALADLVRGRLEIVGVVADLELAGIRELIERVGLDRVQLHGAETPALVQELMPTAYKALGIGSKQDVEGATVFPGERILVDAKVGDLVGGTGKTFDWTWVNDLCRSRRVVLAGGLGPDNVAAAIAQLHPFGIDVASGVEPLGLPGRKDEQMVRRFIQAIRDAERVP